MFSPDPFPLQGDIFERKVKVLRGTPRDNYNVLYHFHLLSRPQCWEDKLQAAQKRLCFPIFKPEIWYESGAAGEFISAMQAVPVLGLLLVRRLNVLKYVGISTYNGRVAIFSIRALEQISQWEEKIELLPPEVRTWLADPDIVVMTSGEKRTFQKAWNGFEVTAQLDTERLYKLYQDAGVIRPAVPPERGDLAWQLAYAIGYHPLPSRKSTWLQLIGQNKFKAEKRDWPNWRMPGWQPDGIWRLDEREMFFLYFSTYGPHMFVSRLLRHGLVYGGMEAVAKEVPLRDLFLVFLLGAMNEGTPSPQDPLALGVDGVALVDKRDKNSPAVRLYNPKYAHLPAVKAQPGELREVPKLPSSAPTTSSTSSSTAPTAQLPLPPEERDPTREEGDPPCSSPNSATEALHPPPVVSDLEEGEIADGGEGEEKEEELVIFIDEAGEELFEEELDDNNNRATTTSTPPAKRRRSPAGADKKEENIRAALLRLASSEDIKESPPLLAAAAPSAAAAPVPLANRLGPPPSTQGVSASLASRLGPCTPPSAPGPGYFTSSGAANARGGQDPLEGTSRQHLPPAPAAAGAEEGKGTTSCYAPFDARSRKTPEKASAIAYREEAAAAQPVPVAVIAPDRNLVLAARTKRGPKPQGAAAGIEKKRADRRRHRALSRRLLDHATLSVEEVLNNPYVDQPIFDKRCSFCASWHCSRFLRGTREPNCRKYREQRELAPTRRLCDYRRCLLPNDHHTAVCPALHGRCPVCHCRGHGVVDSCNLADDRIMNKLRYDFEECADIGVYTKKRFQNLAWGFYPYPSSAPRDTAVISYRRLSDMPVDCAFAALKSVLQLPENQPLPQGGLLQGGLYLAHHGARAPEGGVPDPQRRQWEDDDPSYSDDDLE